MSYTVVIDEAERERRAENRLNELLRRCRIGKVKRKRNQRGVLYGPSWEWLHNPFGTQCPVQRGDDVGI